MSISSGKIEKTNTFRKSKQSMLDIKKKTSIFALSF